MATISAPDLVKLRTNQQRLIGYLSILRPTTLLSATVIGSPVRGARSISYNTGSSSSFGTIEAGQTIVFDTAYGQQRTLISSISGTAVAGTITLYENGLLLTNGDILTIYHNYEIHPIPPAIRSEVFYKFYDIPYSNQNSQPNPIAIAGPHKAGWLTTQSVSVPIVIGTDDGHVTSLGQYINNSSVVSFGDIAGINVDSWLRFQNVQIPNAAHIISASLSLMPDTSQSTTVTLKISGENAANPAAPISYADYIGKSLTTAQVDWDFSTAWTANTRINSIDISTIIQEIVNLVGWASGNALQIFIKDDGGSDRRSIYSYNTSPAYTAILNITYTSTAATFSLDASPSYAIANGATISSFLWSCIKNGGGTSGISFSATNVANPTLTITEVGQYWLKLTVTDSNGKTQSTYRALWVYDRNGTQPYTDFSIQSLAGDWQSGGWRCNLTSTGSVELSDFPDYALVLIWYDNYFNDAEGYVNLWSEGDNVILAGYLRQDTDNDDFDNGKGNVAFSITTIDDLLNNICELGTVSLNAATSPTKWYEYASWMTAGRSIHHLILWHSWGVFQTGDVLGLTSNTLGVKNTDYSESSLLQQINTFVNQRGIFAKLISNRLGQMYLAADIQMLNTAGRAALDIVFTIVVADVSGIIDVVRSPEEMIVFAQLDGFAFDGSTSSPYISIGPGYRESNISYIIPNERGSSIANVSNQILASQTDANEKIGRYVALANNNPRELRFSLPGNYLGAFDIIPSQGWYRWGIADANLKRQLELYDKNFVCRNVSHILDFQTGIIQTSVVLEKEAVGLDGIEGNYPTSYPTSTSSTPNWTPPETEADILLIYNSGSTHARVATYVSSSSLVVGPEAVVDANSNGQAVTVALSATKALVVYYKGSATWACVLDIANDTITPGVPVDTGLGYDNTFFAGFSLDKISSTSALLVYPNINTFYAVVLSVSGTTITVNTPLLVSAGSWRSFSVSVLSSSLAIILSADFDSTIYAFPIAISGIVLSNNYNEQIELDTTYGISSAKINSNAAIIVYENVTDGYLQTRILTSISTDGLTNNLPANISAVASATLGEWIRCVSNSKAIVCWEQLVTVPNAVRTAEIVISGGTATPGSVSTISTNVEPSMFTFYPGTSISLITTDRALVAWGGQAGGGSIPLTIRSFSSSTPDSNENEFDSISDATSVEFSTTRLVD